MNNTLINLKKMEKHTSQTKAQSRYTWTDITETHINRDQRGGGGESHDRETWETFWTVKIHKS